MEEERERRGVIENYGTLSREVVTMKGAAIRRDDNMTQIRA